MMRIRGNNSKQIIKTPSTVCHEQMSCCNNKAIILTCWQTAARRHCRHTGGEGWQSEGAPCTEYQSWPSRYPLCQTTQDLPNTYRQPGKTMVRGREKAKKTVGKTVDIASKMCSSAHDDGGQSWLDTVIACSWISIKCVCNEIYLICMYVHKWKDLWAVLMTTCGTEMFSFSFLGGQKILIVEDIVRHSQAKSEFFECLFYSQDLYMGC